MKSLLNPNLGIVFLFTIIAAIIVFAITYFVRSAKRKTGISFLYMLTGGIVLGVAGIAAKSIDNAFYFYLVWMFWLMLIGTLHTFLSDKLLEWTSNESFGWKLLYSLAVLLAGMAALFSFMQLGGYKLIPSYNFIASSAFFVPVLLVYAFECFLAIPTKVYIQQKPWVYNRNTELQFRQDEVSHFYLIKYRLTPTSGGERIDSLVLRAPGNLKLGDYFNATLEVNKVRQDRYTIETRDRSNKSFGWYFFLADGSSNGRMIDPNKTFIELGFTNPVYYGNASTDQIEDITKQADREGKAYTIICKREHEYKSQLM
jgi:hypothetical protein